MMSIQLNTQVKVLFGLLACSLIILTPGVQAKEWGKSVIKLPGAQFEQKTGLFNTQQVEYRDALGNRASKRTRWWGREERDASLLGASYHQKGNRDISIQASGNHTIYQQHKSIFGRTTRTIDLSKW